MDKRQALSLLTLIADLYFIVNAEDRVASTPEPPAPAANGATARPEKVKA